MLAKQQLSKEPNRAGHGKLIGFGTLVLYIQKATFVDRRLVAAIYGAVRRLKLTIRYSE
jgi:hypothetical protein